MWLRLLHWWYRLSAAMHTWGAAGEERGALSALSRSRSRPLLGGPPTPTGACLCAGPGGGGRAAGPGRRACPCSRVFWHMTCSVESTVPDSAITSFSLTDTAAADEVRNAR